MYEHVRARLLAVVADRQADVGRAQAGVTAAQAAVGAAQDAVAAAQAAVAAAEHDLAAARVARTAADARVDAAAEGVRQAQQAVEDWELERPDEPGRDMVAWVRRMAQLQRALRAAQTQLSGAQAGAAAAAAAVGSAQAAVAARQGDVQARLADVTRAETAVDAAEAAVDGARAAVAVAEDAVLELDRRTARLTAAFDRDDLELLADQEQVEIGLLRVERAGRRGERHTASVARDGVLADSDADVTALAALAQAMHGWAHPTLPDPPQVAAVLDVIVAGARAQAAGEPRTDDLAGLVTAVAAALDRLQVTVAQATGLRDQAVANLQSVIAEVQAIAEGAP